jgi:hypothetical protein
LFSTYAAAGDKENAFVSFARDKGAQNLCGTTLVVAKNAAALFPPTVGEGR